MSTAKPYFIYPGYALVAYPNRDSTTYKERYAIPEAQTVIRGTLRFQGFPEFIKVLVDIGFLSEEAKDYLSASNEKPLAWKDALAKVLGADSNEEKDLEWAISSKTKFKDNDDKARILSGFKWLGLFSDAPIIPVVTLLTLCVLLLRRRCSLRRASVISLFSSTSLALSGLTRPLRPEPPLLLSTVFLVATLPWPRLLVSLALLPFVKFLTVPLASLASTLLLFPSLLIL